jgi:hypothetical protein
LKIGWLTSICISGAEIIIISNGDIWLLFPVFIHVAENKTEATIIIRPPAFVARFDYSTTSIGWLGITDLERAQAAEEEAENN